MRREEEYCKAITLRSGRELEISEQQPAVREGEIKEEGQVNQKDHMQGERLRETRSIDDNKGRKETEK